MTGQDATTAAPKPELPYSWRDRGPLVDFDVTWASGKVERVQGHRLAPFPGGPGSGIAVFRRADDGVYGPALALAPGAYLSVRRIFDGEAAPAAESSPAGRSHEGEGPS